MEPRPKRLHTQTIVISGYFGAGNTGDEAILAAMLAALRAELPAAEFVVLARDPRAVAAVHGTPSLHYGFRDLWPKLKLFRRCALLLSGGGGLFQDAFPRRFLPVSVLYYGSICILAKFCGAKVMFYAQGVGPLRGRIARWVTKIAAVRADCLSVRDRDSAILLRRLGVGQRPIHVTADPVLAWVPESERGVLPHIGLAADRPLCAISVRPWAGDDALLGVVAEVADRAAQAWGMTPVLISFARDLDRAAGERVRARMREAERAMVLPDLAPEQVREIIGRSEIMLGMRLHALIFAATAGVPMVGLIYDPKVQSFLDSLGLSDQACPLTTGADGLWHRLTLTREKKTEIVAAIRAAAGTLHDRALDNVRLVRALLELEQDEASGPGPRAHSSGVWPQTDRRGGV